MPPYKELHSNPRGATLIRLLVKAGFNVVRENLYSGIPMVEKGLDVWQRLDLPPVLKSRIASLLIMPTEGFRFRNVLRRLFAAADTSGPFPHQLKNMGSYARSLHIPRCSASYRPFFLRQATAHSSV